MVHTLSEPPERMTTTQPQLPTIDFADVGPAVGDAFPDLALPDQHGETINLHAVRRGRRALVVFHRSARW